MQGLRRRPAPQPGQVRDRGIVSYLEPPQVPITWGGFLYPCTCEQQKLIPVHQIHKLHAEHLLRQLLHEHRIHRLGVLYRVDRLLRIRSLHPQQLQRSLCHVLSGVEESLGGGNQGSLIQEKGFFSPGSQIRVIMQ